MVTILTFIPNHTLALQYVRLLMEITTFYFKSLEVFIQTMAILDFLTLDSWLAFLETCCLQLTTLGSSTRIHSLYIGNSPLGWVTLLFDQGGLIPVAILWKLAYSVNTWDNTDFKFALNVNLQQWTSPLVRTTLTMKITAITSATQTPSQLSSLVEGYIFP